MKDTISLTVPMEYNALTRASDMLHGLALDLNKDPCKIQNAGVYGSHDTPAATAEVNAGNLVAGPGASSTACDDQFREQVLQVVAKADDMPANILKEVIQNTPELAMAKVIQSCSGGQELDPSLFAASPASSAAATDTPTPNTTTPAATVTPAPVATAPAGVTLADGIPWDHRIHSKSKLTLAKAPHGWKMKRNVDKALIAQVEAELRAAMAAGPAPAAVNPTPAAVNPTPAAGPVNPAPAAVNPAPAAGPVNPAPAAGPVNPAPAAGPVNPAPAVVGITTFPLLLAAITSAGIDDATVLAAVNAQGLTAIVMLSARPDLIPAVAKALGV